MSKTDLNKFKRADVECTLKNFIKKYPNLWDRLVNDKDLYIDIRKNNNIEIYYNGWCIFNISKTSIYTNTKFIPFHLYRKNVEFQNGCCEIKINLDINDFDKAEQETDNKEKHSTYIGEIKKIINKYSTPEKTIQGKYATNAKDSEKKGIILDTEFAFNDKDEKNRIDLVYLSKKDVKLYFIELKLKEDSRLKPLSKNAKEKKEEKINIQIKNYRKLLSEETKDLTEYYKQIFEIKRDFNLINKFAKQEELNDIAIDKLTIESKPILLIGNKEQKKSDFEKNINDSNEDFYKSIRENIFNKKPIIHSINKLFINLDEELCN